MCPDLSRPVLESRRPCSAPPRASGPAPFSAPGLGRSDANSSVSSAPYRLSGAWEAAPTQTPAGLGGPLWMGRRAEQRGGLRPRPARRGRDSNRRLSALGRRGCGDRTAARAGAGGREPSPGRSPSRSGRPEGCARRWRPPQPRRRRKGWSRGRCSTSRPW